MDLGTILAMVSVAAAPATIGIGVMALGSSGDYRIARVCFWLTAVLGTGAIFMIQWSSAIVLTPARIAVNGLAGAITFICLTLAMGWIENKQVKGSNSMSTSHEGPQAQGGKGGSGEVFGDGVVIGGAGGRVGAGGAGRGGDGGGGVIHGSGVTIGGQGGSVDGAAIWYPPAASGFPAMMGGSEPDYGATLPGQGGMSPGYLEKFQIIGKIREYYFRSEGMNEKLLSSKLADVPLDFLNQDLEREGYLWRARIEGRWYLFYVP